MLLPWLAHLSNSSPPVTNSRTICTWLSVSKTSFIRIYDQQGFIFGCHTTCGDSNHYIGFSMQIYYVTPPCVNSSKNVYIIHDTSWVLITDQWWPSLHSNGLTNCTCVCAHMVLVIMVMVVFMSASMSVCMHVCTCACMRACVSECVWVCKF